MLQRFSAKVYQLFRVCSRSGSRIVCPYHPDANLIEDYHAGDMICPDCGLVVGDRYGSASLFHPVHCNKYFIVYITWMFWSTAYLSLNVDFVCMCLFSVLGQLIDVRSYLEYLIENAQNTATCITLCKMCYGINFLDF